MGAFVFDTTIGLIGAGLTATVCLFALMVGDRLERIGAVANLTAWLVTNLLIKSFGDEGQGNWFMLFIDLALLTTFATIVWKAPRNWPVWACAFQILIVASQVLILSNFDTPMLSFYIIVNLASLGILISIAVGTFMAWQERAAIGRAHDELGGYS